MSTVDETIEQGAEYLEHYGIRGMKWGQRRSKEEIRRAKSLPDAEEHTRARTLHKTARQGGLRKLTNKDIEDLNKRLNLEQNYSNLTQKSGTQNSVVKKGSAWVGGKILKVGDMATDEITRAHTRVYLHQRGLLPQIPKN